MTMPSKETSHRFGLKAATIDKITSVFARYPAVESAILYGSRAKGNYREGSDIDLTLTGEQLTYRTLLRIEDEIDDLLLPYLFDISIFSHIDDPDVIDHIRRVGVPFYERSPGARTAQISTSRPL
ncbi:MAG: nucleotidyltransferase domain-containing protein [Phormidesmis sp.]